MNDAVPKPGLEPAFLAGGGNVGAILREHDWSASPLGPLESWPQSLRSALSTCLNSRAVSAVFWGPEFRLLYNDAYRPFLDGRHPWALGRPMSEIWPTMWQALTASARQVLETGEGVVAENQRLMMERDGGLVESFWFYSFAPIRDESGTVGGIFLTAIDTTAQVLAQRRLASESERLSRLFEQAPGFMSLMRGPEHIFELANPAYMQLIGHRDVLGKPVREAMPEIAGQGFFELLDTVYATGQPFVGHSLPASLQRTPGGPIEQRFVDLVYQPITDAEGLVTGIFVEGSDVTERKKTETALAEREHELRTLTDALPVLVSYIDAERRYRFNNKVYETWFPRKREEIVGKLVREVVGEAAYAKVAHHMDAALRGERVSFSQFLPYADVPGRHVEVEYIPRQAPDGSIEGFFTLVQDVTARKAAEEALRASEDRLRAIVETATDYAIFTTDLEGRIETWPAGASEVFGWSAEEVVGQLVDMTYTPQDRAEGVPEKERQVAREKGQAPNVRWHLRKDGSRVFIDGVLRPLDGKDGTPSGFVKVGQDVTERRQAEVRRDALIHLADRLRDLDDPVEIAFAAAEILGQTLGVSRVGYATIDAEAETLHVERDWTAPGIGTLAGTLRFRDYGSYVDGLKRGEQIAISDVCLDPRTADAASALEARRARSFVNVPVLERGRLVAMFFVIDDDARDWPSDDLTFIQEVATRTRTAVERARSAIALRELNETLEQRVAERTAELAERTAERDRLWTLSEDMLARADYQGMMSSVSPAWTRVLGWSETELLTRPYSTFMHPEDMEGTLAALARMGETGRPTRFENRIATSDGGWKPIEWTVAPELDSPNFIAVGRDLSEAKSHEEELRQAQEALRQSQKMEAVGQLTGGLAHDFNNLLTGISGSLELMATRINQGRYGDVDRYLAAAQGASRRAAALTHRLLAFSRRQTLAPKVTDVNALVAGMEDLIRRTVGPEIALESITGSSIWSVEVDPNQLENALLNLAINARDAMPDGGSLKIETANRSMDARAAREQELSPGQYVTLSVSDTGVGMPREVVARAFEPFFTTKPLGLGTGLGLSMVYGFARQSGGQVRITSEVGKGTTICLYLPRYVGSEDKETPSEVATAIPTGVGETVLVIDDEAVVRMLVVDVLEELGYAPLEASNGPEGLEILQSKARVDLLITDVGLPGGLNGRQVADAARTLRPELKVLFITGYAENAVLNQSHLGPDMQVITKPFAVEDLARRIRAILRQG